MKKIDKYQKMHTDILDTCRKHNIRIMPGKVAANEILDGSSVVGLKDFLIRCDEMDRFLNEAAKELTGMGYLTKLETHKSSRICKVFRTDMLATTVYKLMKDPDDLHYPQIIIREFTQKKDICSFPANGKTVSFDAKLLDTLERTEYRENIVYAPKDIEAYLKELYEDDFRLDDSYIGYTVFDPNCSPEIFIRIAKERGYFSRKCTKRYMAFRIWKKTSNAKQIAKNYREYQETLLGLKPDPVK
ncbi:MAG: hypothetical protein IKK29_01930 [Christensenellaceae bacterium]|nr:hypothetical protein [Christensenellaceae bacterium]